MKVCTKCGREKPLDEFHNTRKTKDGKTQACAECRNKGNKEYRKNNPGVPEVERARNLKHRFGMTLEQYDDMLEGQCNGCAICGKSPEDNGKRLAVDHNHYTGEVRALLCDDCNRALGLFKDDVTTIQSAINYLRRK